MQRQLKLSRREGILAALAALVLLLALATPVLLRRETSSQEELRASIRRARLVLDEAQQNTDTTRLQAQKNELQQALEQASTIQVDGGAVALSLGGWASASNVTLKALEYGAESAKFGDLTLIAHRYSMAVAGDPKSLHRLLTMITASPYNPAVEILTISHGAGEGAYELNLGITVYAQEARAS